MQPVGGISRYLSKIVNGLPPDWTPVITVGTTRQAEYRRLRFPTHPHLLLKHFPAPYLRPRKLHAWAAKKYFAGIEAREGFSLIHSVHHGSLASERPVKNRVPFVLTVHDMIPEIFGRERDPDGRDTRAKQKAVEAADAVICVSENTRKDLLERIPVPEGRVFVTPLASELALEMSWGPESVPERPYFLFVGTRRAEYKNFARCLQAFARLAEKRADVELWVVGPSFEPDERKLIRDLKMAERVKSAGVISDSHLAKFYRCALALVYPSLYEGFGIPPLEAMACGSLAIVADSPRQTEVTGNAALTVDPGNVDSLVAGMSTAGNLRSDQRQEWIRQGILWSSRFNWGKTVEETVRIYRTLAG